MRPHPALPPQAGERTFPPLRAQRAGEGWGRGGKWPPARFNSFAFGGNLVNTGKGQDTSGYGRRVFLAHASALSAAALFGLPRSALAEPAPETTKIRLVHSPAICTVPEALAEELLRLEGFSEVVYVKQSYNSASALLATGQADIAMDAAPSVTFALGEGKPILALARGSCGLLRTLRQRIHPGCERVERKAGCH